jgi:hypothetical protein
MRSYLGYVSSQTTDTVAALAYGVATGGTSSSVTVGGVNYTLLTFTSSGTLTVTKAGLFDLMFFGGGAGGGGGGGNAGGGNYSAVGKYGIGAQLFGLFLLAVLVVLVLLRRAVRVAAVAVQAATVLRQVLVLLAMVARDWKQTHSLQAHRFSKAAAVAAEPLAELRERVRMAARTVRLVQHLTHQRTLLAAVVVVAQVVAVVLAVVRLR